MTPAPGSSPWRSSPWRTVWTRPRSTIARLGGSGLDRTSAALAAALGIRVVLIPATLFVLGDQLPLAAVLALVLVVGALLGVGLLQLSTLLLRRIGDLFGGDADAGRIRTALAWSYAPHALALLPFALQLILTGGALFSSTTVALAPGSALAGALWALGVIGWGLTLWAAVLAVVGYAEVQRFTLWLSFSSHVFVLVIELGLVALIGILLARTGMIGA